mgnify:CR=1 FL=1
MNGAYNIVYMYDPTAEGGKYWKKFDPSAEPYANDFTQMEPNRGYWIQMSQEADWLISE